MGIAALGLPLSALAAEPSIAARGSHVLLSTSDGRVITWGSDANGQLGTGRLLYRATPQQVPHLPPMTKVTSNSTHNLTLDSHSRVWSWGQNDNGQLGNRVQRNGAAPGRVLHLKDVVDVRAMETATLALDKAGFVYAWGAVDGDNKGEIWAEPTKDPEIRGAVQIATGLKHGFVRLATGKVEGFGINSRGQVGQGTVSGFVHAVVPIPGAVVDIAANDHGGVALTSDGKVWEWGHSGLDQRPAPVLSPREVTGFPAPVARLAARRHSYAILTDGTLWQWNIAAKPAQVAGFSNVVDVALEMNDTVIGIIDTDGRIRIKGRNGSGERGLGTVNNPPADSEVTTVPLTERVRSLAFTQNGVMAVTESGALYTWGADFNGSLGIGQPQASTFPIGIAGLADIKQVATSDQMAMGLTVAEEVWAWGRNSDGQAGQDNRTPISTPVKVPIQNVRAIAAGMVGPMVFLKNDGSVWYTGLIRSVSQAFTPTPLGGLPPIRSIAAGFMSIFAISESGKLWAMGENLFGELGLGHTNTQATFVEVAIPGEVVQVAADFGRAAVLTAAGDVYVMGGLGWGFAGVLNAGFSSVPVKVSGLKDIAEIAVGRSHQLARTRAGKVLQWGVFTRAEVISGRPRQGFHVPTEVAGLDNVIAIAAGAYSSYAVRADGTVWGWGANFTGFGGSVGDGTLTPRDEPVLVIREDRKGRLDAGDWMLDAKPGTAKQIPPGKIPNALVHTSALTTAVLNVDASITVRQADIGKKVGMYVVGLVPPAFLSQVKTAPGTHALAKGLKADQLILVNLTPAGWAIATGQLSAYSTSVSNGALAAANLLVNVNPNTIPGARFCIGYGESATDMLRASNVRDFASLEGAAGAAQGLPCLLSGVYMDGPASAAPGSDVAVRAVVIGQSPGGTVRFRERLNDISNPVPVTPVNSAISEASFTYRPSVAAEYALGAAYSGDALNAVASSRIPLRLAVRPSVHPTSVAIAGPVTSEIGTELKLVAVVSGRNPTGTVVFKRDGVALGAPVPVVGDRATLEVAGLAGGRTQFTAEYSGDGANAASTSALFTHTVLVVSITEVSLGATANPISYGGGASLTITVKGTTSPTGLVTIREGSTVLGTASLDAGSASLTLQGLTPGVHALHADYAGDANNAAATSPALFLQVNVTGAPTPITAKKAGAGGGRITSSPTGLDCTDQCTASFPYADTVTLQATASAGSVFAGWSGGKCSGTGTCTINVEEASTVHAFFVAQSSTPALAANLASYDFGSQSMGTSSAVVPVTITNIGPTAIDGLAVLVDNAAFKGPSNCGTSLAAGAGCVVQLQFAPPPENMPLAGRSQKTGSVKATASGVPTLGIALAGRAEKSLVSHYYQSILGRSPDAGGLDYWEQEAGRVVALGASVNEAWYALAGTFFSSPEYRNRNTSATRFVQDLYKTFLGRDPDSAGIDYWTGQIAGGMPREVVMVGFMFSAEFGSLTESIFGVQKPRAEINTVIDFYRGLLGRLPDGAGFDHWVRQFRAAQCAGAPQVVQQADAISSAYLNSGEYAARNRTDEDYVSDLYNAFLRRGGDLAGVRYWIEQIATGARTRENVRQLFRDSPEFSSRVQAIIAQGCLPQ